MMLLAVISYFHKPNFSIRIFCRTHSSQEHLLSQKLKTPQSGMPFVWTNCKGLRDSEPHIPFRVRSIPPHWSDTVQGAQCVPRRKIQVIPEGCFRCFHMRDCTKDERIRNRESHPPYSMSSICRERRVLRLLFRERWDLPFQAQRWAALTKMLYGSLSRNFPN